MPVKDEQSIGQLVADASRDLSALVRDEIALAKAELKQTVTSVAMGAGLLIGAAVVGVIAIFLLSFAAAYGLVAAGLHEALGFLIVAGVYLLIVAILVLVGIRSLKKAGPPKRTIASVNETKALFSRGDDTDESTATSEPSTTAEPQVAGTAPASETGRT